MPLDVSYALNFLGGMILGDSGLIDQPDREQSADLIANELLPYRSFDRKTGLYLNRRSMGFVLEIVPLLGADDRIVGILSDLFRDGIDDHTHIQVISWASPRVGHILERWREARSNASPVYQALARYRSDHLQAAAWRSLSKTAPFHVRNFRVLISAGIESTDFEENAPKLESLRESMVATLRNIGGDARVMEPRSLIGFLDEVLNPRRDAATVPVTYNSRDFIHKQVMRADTKLNVAPGGITIQTTARKPHSTFRDEWDTEEDSYETKTYETRCFSVKSFPEEFSQWRMSKLIGDFYSDRLRFNCPVLTVLGVSYPSATAATARMQLKSTRSTQQARTSFAAYQPSIKSKAADLQWAGEQIQNGQKYVHVTYQAIAIAERESIGDADKVIRNIYKSAGWDLMLEETVQLQSFALGLPLTLADGLFHDMDRFLRTKTELTRTCANIAPLQGEYLGQSTPHLLFVGRRGQPFYWSPFGNRDGNHNAAYIGQSGSGKSVSLQESVACLRGAGASVIVVDDGRSFENSSCLQGGNFVEFSLQKKICLNPFAMIDHERSQRDKDYRAEALNLMKLTIQQMARAEEPAKDAEKGFIDAAVVSVWEKQGRSGSVEDVCKALTDAGDLTAKDLARSISPYADYGAYGDFFNGPNALTIANDLTVFEMAELESKPELRSVVMLAIMFLTREKMAQGGRSRKTAFVVDEAWQMLGNGASGAFIDGFARRCRKYGGCLMTAAQSITDYLKSDGARAALENSSWRLFHSMKSEAIAAARASTLFPINAATEDILNSLNVSDGEYSEILIDGPNGRHVGRLVLDPYASGHYFSTPEMVAAVTELVDGGMPREKAIQAVIVKNNRGHHVS